MSAGSTFRRALTCAAILLAGAVIVQGQSPTNITSADLFNQVGQYYLAYANDPNSTNTVTVSGLLGTTNGPQAWDFSTGPTNVTYRYDYLAAGNTPFGDDFAHAGAQIAEQKATVGNTNDQSWLYFTQDPLKGRLDYGFYDPTFSSSQPESLFNPALQDFPNAIHFGDTWSGTTVFNTIQSEAGVGDVPTQLTYTSTDTVDAFGVITLPKLGFVNCLRVHELVQYDISINFDGTGYTSAGTEYILNYYWLAPGHGIVVQINSTSPPDGSVPPDNLPGGAAALVRMFALNHPVVMSTNPPGNAILGFKFTLGSPGSGGLLQWTPLSGVTSYRVDYAVGSAGTNNWQPLGTTTSNYILDPAAGTPAAPVRFYRVVGTMAN
jgi:hypothetical protein